VYKVELTVFTGQSLMRTVVEKMKQVILGSLCVHHASCIIETNDLLFDLHV